jgi:hypothetical protein
MQISGLTIEGLHKLREKQGGVPIFWNLGQRFIGHVQRMSEGRHSH